MYSFHKYCVAHGGKDINCKPSGDVFLRQTDNGFKAHWWFYTRGLLCRICVSALARMALLGDLGVPVSCCKNFLKNLTRK